MTDDADLRIATLKMSRADYELAKRRLSIEGARAAVRGRDARDLAAARLRHPDLARAEAVRADDAGADR